MYAEKNRWLRNKPDQAPKWFNMLGAWRFERGRRGLTLPYLVGSCTKDKNMEAAERLIRSMMQPPSTKYYVSFGVCPANLQDFLFILHETKARQPVEHEVVLPGGGDVGLILEPSWAITFCKNHRLEPNQVTIDHFLGDILPEYESQIVSDRYSRLSPGFGLDKWGDYTPAEYDFNNKVTGQSI